MAKTRTFQGSRKKVPFEVKTTMTDGTALKILAKIEGDFAFDCAIEIQKLSRGRAHKEVLVAWGFKLAMDGPRKSAVAVQLPVSVLATRTGKPLKGNGIVVRCGGKNAKNPGHFSISNGGQYKTPQNKFYGYATPEGKWTPTRETPQEVIDYLLSL